MKTLVLIFCLFMTLPGLKGQCDPINFNNYTVSSYGGRQDDGTANIQDGGITLLLQNNAWKSINFSHTVNSNTILEVEFRSTSQGEIHGIGFGSNNNLSPSRVFQLFGTQNWANLSFKTYSIAAGWKKYIINVGQFYTGSFDRVIFVMDHDVGSRNGNAYFRNLIIRNTECATPTCTDGIKNGNETGIDCGGSCPPCPVSVTPWVTSGDKIYYNDGNVGIGTINPQARFTVDGAIMAKEIRVKTDISTFPDYVFNPDYKLRTLENLEAFIQQNRHLPEIPTAEDVADGMYLGEMSKRLLQKIEELTLYIIEQEKRIKTLEQQKWNP